MRETVSICGEGVVMTPAQSNAIICEKLNHLIPQFQRVLASLLKLKEDLSNGIVRWDEIIARSTQSDD